MVKRMFKVSGMHCSACVMKLEGIEDELPGVREVKVSLRKQQAEIQYDEKLVGEPQLRAAFEAAGYGLSPLAG
jgi:copper chaperone CopZ